MKNLIIKEELLVEVLNYLGNQRFNDVVKLINQLSTLQVVNLQDAPAVTPPQDPKLPEGE